MKTQQLDVIARIANLGSLLTGPMGPFDLNGHLRMQEMTADAHTIENVELFAEGRGRKMRPGVTTLSPIHCFVRVHAYTYDNQLRCYKIWIDSDGSLKLEII